MKQKGQAAALEGKMTRGREYKETVEISHLEQGWSWVRKCHSGILRNPEADQKLLVVIFDE